MRRSVKEGPLAKYKLVEINQERFGTLLLLILGISLGGGNGVWENGRRGYQNCMPMAFPGAHAGLASDPLLVPASSRNA